MKNFEISKQPKTFKISLAEAWDTVSESELFIKALKKNGMYRPGLLFSGFDGSEPAKATGLVFCATEEDLVSGEGGEDENPLKYALKYAKPAIAIYDENKVDENESHYGVIFKDPSALLAVVYLVD